MKRILFVLTIVGFLLPLAPRAQADPEVSLDFFYDNLAPYGNWIEVADYGYCFQPNAAVESPDWRPYADGYWAYTEAGWTWVSYEDFGWATYHYGRWADLDSYGWVWVPGYEWGPAWVSWRTGGDYVGWAPLPPEEGGVVYDGGAITGAVDVTFGIGPLYYNFIDIRYIGEPVLRGRLIDRSRNVTIINRTVNVTNITVNNTTVINNGPNLDRVNRFSARPIKRYTLQRETNVSGDVAGRRGNLNRVNGNTIVVAAPAIQRSQRPIAPQQVKAKVDRPKLEKGWQGISDRQQVEQAMRNENPKNIPPPDFPPPKSRAGEAATAQPNENGAAEATHAAQRNRPDQNAERANENRNAGQSAAQPQPRQLQLDRTQQAQEAQRAARPEQPIPPQRVQRPQSQKPPASQNPNPERQGKKKKPSDEASPPP